MAREAFDKKLMDIKNEVLLLGNMVEEAMYSAVEALRKRDLDKAREIYFGDQKINERRYKIEEQALMTIATQQPMAHDLRLLAAILEIITDLERMGDYAKGIARITVKLGAEPPLKPLVDIPRMAELGVEMLHQALQAFVEENVELARKIPIHDDEVDQLYDQVYRELLTYIMADPSTMDRATQLLWIAHKLERFSDRVSNICERVVFMRTGQLSEFDARDEAQKLES